MPQHQSSSHASMSILSVFSSQIPIGRLCALHNPLQISSLVCSCRVSKLTLPWVAVDQAEVIAAYQKIDTQRRSTVVPARYIPRSESILCIPSSRPDSASLKDDQVVQILRCVALECASPSQIACGAEKLHFQTQTLQHHWCVRLGGIIVGARWTLGSQLTAQHTTRPLGLVCYIHTYASHVLGNSPSPYGNYLMPKRILIHYSVKNGLG